MNNKLPKVYVNKQSQKIENNKETFYSHKNEAKLNNYDYNSSKEMVNELIIKRKINDIFSNPNFIYKIKAFIRTDDWEREEILIARTNTSLLTLENKIIPICIIKDINIIN